MQSLRQNFAIIPLAGSEMKWIYRKKTPLIVYVIYKCLPIFVILLTGLVSRYQIEKKPRWANLHGKRKILYSEYSNARSYLFILSFKPVILSFATRFWQNRRITARSCFDLHYPESTHKRKQTEMSISVTALGFWSVIISIFFVLIL